MAGRCQPLATDFGISPLAARIGAQIDNIRLGRFLPAETVAALEASLPKHKVILFRDQARLDPKISLLRAVVVSGP
jgi:alpha-ketoglutarate-dependent sulfate ester dioxygenase